VPEILEQNSKYFRS